MQETGVQPLGGEDPLEKGVATHPNIAAWRIPWIEEPGGLQSKGSQRAGPDWATNTFTFTLLVMWMKILQTMGERPWRNTELLGHALQGVDDDIMGEPMDIVDLEFTGNSEEFDTWL